MNKTYPLFKVIKWLIKVCYPKIKIEGIENLPESPSIIVANHTQMHGPIACEVHFPENSAIWCAGQMMKLKDVPKYAFEDFWSQKPKYTHPFYKLLSYLIAPLSVVIFKNARTIGVYHDTRILTTFKTTIKRLEEGKHIVIFPEYDKKYNNIIYDFQEKYIDIAKLYFKKTGKKLNFVPMYIAPNLKKMYIGEPIEFMGEKPISEERGEISKYLMDEITNIATHLPRHKVVPYRNIPKKQYPYNKEG